MDPSGQNQTPTTDNPPEQPSIFTGLTGQFPYPLPGNIPILSQQQLWQFLAATANPTNPTNPLPLSFPVPVPSPAPVKTVISDATSTPTPTDPSPPQQQAKRFSYQQTEYMRNSFAQDPKPSDVVYKQISAAIGLSEQQVRNWFTRERMKAKATRSTPQPSPDVPNTAAGVIGDLAVSAVNIPTTEPEDLMSRAQHYLASMGTQTPMLRGAILAVEQTGDKDKPVSAPVDLTASASAAQSASLYSASPGVLQQAGNTETPSDKVEVKSMSPAENTPLSVQALLQPILNGQGGLKDVDDISEFVRIAGLQTDWTDRRQALQVLLMTKEQEILRTFVRKQGLKLIAKMLVQAKDSAEQDDVAAFAKATLELLLKLPIVVDDLREVKIGKVVKHFSSLNAGPHSEAIQTAAGNVMRSWQTLITKQKAPEATKPEKKHQEDKPERKRERNISENGAPTGPPAKKPKGGPDAEKNAVSSNARKAVQAVDNFDIFKSLSRPSLPKIRKLETPAIIPPQNLVLEAEAISPEDSPVAASVTDTPPVGSSSVLINPASIPSYRSEPSSNETPTSGKKKRVRFAEGDDLVSIRYFEKEPPFQSHESNHEYETTPHQHGNARDFDRQEGHRAFRRELEPTIDWAPPYALDWTQSYEWGTTSTEAKVQEEREKSVPVAVYYTDEQVPPTPAEPDEDIVSESEQITPGMSTAMPNAPNVLGQLAQLNSGNIPAQPAINPMSLLTNLASINSFAQQPNNINIQSLLQLLQQAGLPPQPSINPPAPVVGSSAASNFASAAIQSLTPQVGADRGGARSSRWGPRESPDQQDQDASGGYARSGGQHGNRRPGPYDRPYRGNDFRGGGRGGGGGFRGRGRIPCYFYAQGKCNKGDECRFSHEDPPSGFSADGSAGGM